MDHQGKPDVGQTEAERLITQEKVHALFGAYFSSVTATASQVAERYGVPYLNAESSSPGLTERGFKWFFRTSPHDGHFSVAMFDFMKDLEKRRGVKIKTLGIMHEDTLFGVDSAKVQEELAKKYGYEVVVKMAYRAKTTNLDAEVGKLKAANPDVFLPTSYTSDAFLFVKTAKNLDYNPKLLIAQDAGWTDPSFLTEMGKDAEGHITRAPFALDMADKKPMITPVNELFKKMKDNPGGRDISDVPARAFTGFIVLADAINRAKKRQPRGDPQGARGHQHAARAAHHALERRQVRREGPEHRRARHPPAGPEGQVRHHLPLRAGRRRRRLSADALEGPEVAAPRVLSAAEGRGETYSTVISCPSPKFSDSRSRAGRGPSPWDHGFWPLPEAKTSISWSPASGGSG